MVKPSPTRPSDVGQLLTLAKTVRVLHCLSRLPFLSSSVLLFVSLTSVYQPHYYFFFFFLHPTFNLPCVNIVATVILMNIFHYKAEQSTPASLQTKLSSCCSDGEALPSRLPYTVSRRLGTFTRCVGETEFVSSHMLCERCTANYSGLGPGAC